MITITLKNSSLLISPSSSLVILNFNSPFFKKKIFSAV